MKPAQKIEDLKRQIQAEEQKLRNCKHSFEDAIFDPEITREPSGYTLEVHGSDAYPVATGYKDVSKNRWSRECSICGKKEYTYNQKPVIKEYKPSFD